MKPIFSRKVKRLRLSLGLQQDEFAHLISVSTQMVSAYENAKSVPRFSTLMKLADKANQPIAWFFLDEEHDDYELVPKGREKQNRIDLAITQIEAIEDQLQRLRVSLSGISE